jgi:hypothetical protein
MKKSDRQPYVNAVKIILQITDSDNVYKECRYSLLHKVISDATHSSTPTLRYKQPYFYWSRGAVDAFLKRYHPMAINWAAPPPRIVVTLPKSFSNEKLLHKEHIVPTGKVIHKLLGLVTPTDDEIDRLLEHAFAVCIIEKNEDARLHRTEMPQGHEDFMTNRWARYSYPRKGGGPIRVSPFRCDWNDQTVTFTLRDVAEMDGVPT